jgi:hypothetical protein
LSARHCRRFSFIHIGYHGDPFTGCELADPCRVHANGGCSVYATCSVNSANERVCTCREGYKGDGTTCRFALCDENNGGCHADATCYAGYRINGKMTRACRCHLGFSGNGEHCEQYDPCMASNGGCAHSCIRQGSQAHTCACRAGYLLEEDGVSCTPATPCKETADRLACGEHAFCAEDDDGVARCACQAGYEDVSDAVGKPAGHECRAINPCLGGQGDSLCPETLQQCLNPAPGVHECRCREGYAMNATRHCVAIDLCGSQYVSGCHHDAICVTVGPGQAKCEFRGRRPDVHAH